MKDLSASKILKYDSILEELTLYNLGEFQPDKDGLYYIKKDSKRLGDLNNLFIKLKSISYHFKSNEGASWSIEKTTKPLEANALLYIRFKIVGAYYSYDKLVSKSRLKGFGRVIDDNNYFSSVPLINQLTHWDNGVIVTPNYQTEITSLDETRHNNLLIDWSSFKIVVTNNFKGDKRLLMTAERGHETL